MKKRFLNMLMVLIVVLSCGFLSACGNRYKDMEFSVQYAFADDKGVIGQWYDAGQNLSLNFGDSQDKLVIQNKQSNLVFKINIKNVKAKYIDDLIIYDSNSSSSQIVKQDKVFTIKVQGAMQSSIRIYETKSGKETSLKLNIFESLQTITTNTDFKPALVVGKTVNLNNLSSANESQSALLFSPVGTNQTAVDFSIVGLGYYDNGQWKETRNSTSALQYVELAKDGSLTIKSNFDANTNPVVKLKATSKFYKNENEKSTTFDVYVIESLSNVDAPVVSETGKTTKLEQKTLYVNDDSENKEYKLVVDVGIGTIESKYIKGVTTANGDTARYGLNVYVDEQLVDMDSYADYNGIRIQPLQTEKDKAFMYEITADEKSYLTYPRNTIRFELKVLGLDYVIDEQLYSASLNITKRSIIKDITLNGETNDTYKEGKIFVTANSSVSQNGLNLLVDVAPNDNESHLVLISATSNLNVTGRSIMQLSQAQTIAGKTYTMAVMNGSNINVTFKQNSIESADGESISFTTYKKVDDSTAGYVDAYTLDVKKVVTANRFEVLTSSTGIENFVDKTILTNAENETNFYLRIYYTGNSLATDTIDLTLPTTSRFAFKNGATSINLKNDITSAGISQVAFKTAVGSNGEYYETYCIPLKATQAKDTALVTIFAGKTGNTALFESSFTVQSVYVASTDEFVMRTEGQNIFKIGSESETSLDRYAIVNNYNLKSELHFGQMVSGLFNQFSIANVELVRSGKDDSTDFSASAVDYLALGKTGSVNKYQIWGVQGSKTTHFTATIIYYVQENGVISTTSVTKEFEIAVYNSISSIDMNFASGSSNEIVYINRYYESAASSTIKFDSKSFIATPSQSVKFGANGNEEIVEDINKLKLSVTGDYRSIKIYLGSDEILLDNNGTAVDEHGNRIYLSALTGNLTVKLIKKPETSQQFVTINLTAVSFGTELAVSKAITINFGSYVQSDDIALSGEALTSENNTININMSFLNVADGGVATSNFNATVVYNQLVATKYDDLDYILYEILQDEDGNPILDGNKQYTAVELSKAENRLNITINKLTGLVSIGANKSLGGGMFKLRLVALDSYDESTNKYTNFRDVFITITDGSTKARYKISSADDFRNIANNLNAHYVLTKDIVVTNHTTFDSFSGSISGKYVQFNDVGGVVETKRNLTVTISRSSTATDNVYYGLFTKLTGNASITDLNLNIQFEDYLKPTSTDSGKSLYIGGLAGVIESNVKINNVQFEIDFSGLTFNRNSISTDVYLGGVAGEMANNFNLANSKVTTKGAVYTAFNATNKYLYLGGVAGKLTGSIVGSYRQASDLEKLAYNVGMDIAVTNADLDVTLVNRIENNVLIGGIAGESASNAVIKGFVTMGQINVNGLKATGYLSGLVGKSASTTIVDIVMLGVNLTASSQNLKLAGAVGEATAITLTSVKFMSFKLEDGIDAGIKLDENKAYGIISNNLGVVAGLVANANSATISLSSVENYVKDKTFSSLTAKQVYGLVCVSESASSVQLETSYINANIAADSSVTSYLISNSTAENCYFIGRFSGNRIATTGSVYTAVYDDSTLFVNDNPVDFDRLSTTEQNQLETGVSGEMWKVEQSFNTLAVNGYVFYLPYLVNNFTLIPTDITTILNQQTIKDINSLYVGDYTKNEDTDKKDELNNIIKHGITETAIVNYYNDINNPLNNINLNTHIIDDLVNLTKVPNSLNTIGAIVYKIIKGADYASIVNNNEIYFKGTSNQDYILIKAYSLFNPDACDYFLIYTQNWYSDIVLEADNLQAVGTGNTTYQLSTYKGVQNLEIDLDTINTRQNDSTNYKSLFDVDNISEFVEILATIQDAESSVLTISKNPNLFNRFVLNSTDTEISGTKTETIIFTTKFNLTKFFGTEIYPQQDGVDQYLTLATKQINVNISETATALEFSTDHLEGESSESYVVTATLTTGYVDSENPEVDAFVKPVSTNNIVEFDEENHDSLIMNFSVIDGTDEYSRLLKQSGKTTIPELFDIEVFNNFNETNKTYTYNIAMQLKNSYNTRYLTSEISFAIKIYAKTNPSIDGGTTVQLTIRPSTLSSSVVINNYAASSAEAMGNYTYLITSSQVETANITPGGNGGVLTVRMQPSYAHIKQVSLKSSELYVPSLNENVKIRFEQIVYHTGLGKYISISPSCAQTEDGMGVYLKLASATTDGVSYTFDGTIYVHVVLDKKFSGLADEIRLTLDVTNADDTHIVKTKSLVTDYLPGVDLSYDEDYKITAKVNGKDTQGYLIQQNTTNNIVTLKIYGYQFNANPVVNITDLKGNSLGLDVDYQWLDKYSELKANSDGSYSMRLQLALRNSLSKPFKVTVGMSLVSNTEIKTEDSSINFFPTDYILNKDNTSFDFGSTLNLAINQARDLTFNFATNDNNIDFSNEIYNIILSNIKNQILASAENQTLTEEQLKTKVFQKLMSMFTYKVDDSGITSSFDVENDYFEVFTTNYGSGSEAITNLRIKAKGKFKTSVQFKINYNYVYDEATGVCKLVFGSQDTTMLPHVLTINFDMNFYTATTRQDAFAISQADQMFDANGNCILGEGQNYVLTNDIVVEIAKPISTAIASLDGNNKKIIIKNFVVSNEASENAGYYGLFATVSENTLLYNLVVDYSQFNASQNGQLVLAYENLNNVVFGGLAAVNNGLIYNCDVINASSSSTKVVNILINNNAETSITFGGLVGVNNGTITNSRVGTSEFTKIIANDNSQTSYTEYFKPLNFVLGNRTLNQGQGFKSITGGFVGINSSNSAISSSYVANTSLYTYSTNSDSKLAGFVAENSGKISYSYVKGIETTITNENPFSTGAKIEAHADGNIAGFVYDNMSGANINNSFANIELVSKSAFMAGFVFRNNSGAKVSQCYSACTFANANSDTTLQITPEQPFVGADTTGSLSNGELENCYWYKDTNKQQFVVAETDGKPTATGLNATNFADTNNLINFVFVLSNSKNDRDQGIWSFYDNRGNAVKLPELTIANNVAYSFRYESNNTDNADSTSKYTYATKFSLGSKNNPEIISSVQEFNDVFTNYGTSNNFAGYVRLIADIDFASDKAAIATRRQFTLGSKNNTNDTTYSSLDGNGMAINNIYLDVGEDKEEMVGLFAKINRAYIKNLNLHFSSGNFSTANSIYSGGLAGKITDSVIINISLDGVNTTIQGANMVGGLAGLIDGQSLIYGISSNLSVSTILSGTTELYSSTKNANSANNSYAQTVSYAGGIAGVIDVTTRSYSSGGEGYNLSYIYINDNAVDVNDNLTITADYAGGVAGYVGKSVKSVRVSFNVGSSNRIDGQYSAGGLYGASIGASMEASKVSALDTDEAQFKYDSTLAKYVLDMSKPLDKENIGNAGLIESYTYGGGLVGISVGSSIFSCYSKASFYAGKNIGGLIGVDVLSNNNFNYAVPFINFEGNMETVKTIGGLIGIAEDASSATFGQVYTNLGAKTGNSQNYTFSTILLENEAYKTFKQNLENQNITIDVKLNNFIGEDRVANHVISQVYVGEIAYSDLIVANSNIAGLTIKSMRNLYNLEVSEVQLSTYNSIFSIWDTKYWNLDTHSRYFPLLTDQRDENYEIIKDAQDFEKIKNNPTGSFKITDDVNMSNYKGGENFVFDFEFSGVLIGEKSDGSTPIVYNLNVKAPNNADAGLFRATSNATFRNIEFSWKKYGVGGEGNKVKIKNFAGFSGNDEKSKISAIMVTVGRINRTETDAVELFAHAGRDESVQYSSITGFAGLITTALGTNILNSSFSGQVSADIDLTNSTKTENFVGGLVGYGNTDIEDIENTMSIINSSVGTLQNTSFNFKVSGNKQLDVGLLAGALKMTAVSGNSIGSLTSSVVSKNIDLNIVLNNFTNSVSVSMYASGMIGVVEDCNIEDNVSFHTIKVSEQSGISNKNANLYLAGLVGKYLLSAEDTGRKIVNCDVSSNIISTVSSASSTTASAGIALVETVNNVYIEQCLFTGSISTVGNANVGGTIGYAYKSTGKTKINFDQIVSSVDISSKFGKLQSEETETAYIGGLVGRVDGSLILSNSINLGKITPSAEGNVNYYIGGLAGSTENVVLATGSYSFSLSSILANGLKGETITQVLPSANNTTTFRKMGALFGFINSTKVGQSSNYNMFVGEASTSNFYQTNADKNSLTSDLFYSTDMALQPEDTMLGTNLSAGTLINSMSYQTKVLESGVWSNTASNTSNVPYITSMRTSMRQFEIFENATDDYKSGLVANPKRVYTGSDQVMYYLVGDNFNIANTFTGIAVGNGNVIKTGNAFYINNLGDSSSSNGYSAISNIHIKYENFDVTRPLVNVNFGTIFNCSIIGSINSVANTSADGKGTGLIVNDNNGLISYCFNSADTTTQNQTGAIALNNNATIVSSYFTGSITVKNNSKYGYAFAENVSSDAYIYNCYSAGNIDKINFSSFVGVDLNNGGNNIIDKLATPSDAGIDQADLNKTNLTVSSTFDLMNATNLDGNWHTAISGKKLDLTDGSMFGYNYNYPIYDFNQYTSVIEGSLNKAFVTQYSRQTGRGLNNTDDWFEVPHLGVLNSIQGVIANDTGANRYYKITRKIDGGIYEQHNKVDTVNWYAVGVNDETLGFAASTNGFTGTIDAGYLDSTNKVKSYSISNLSVNGLFTNIKNAVYNNIKFEGLFERMSGSGALGVEVNGTVLVTNVDVGDLTVSGTDVSILFGTMRAGSIQIGDFVDENTVKGVDTIGTTQYSSGMSKLIATHSGNYGFVLSKMIAGTISIYDEEIHITNEFDNGVASTEDHTTTGGLVGSVENGTIESKGKTTLFITSASYDVFGGLIGEVASESTNGVAISNFHVKFENDTFMANQFGGFVGVVNNTITINQCTIEDQSIVIAFVNGDNRFFGLLAGKITGSGKLNFNGKLELRSQLIIQATTAAQVNETTQGFGSLVGNLSTTDKGGITVEKDALTYFQPTLIVTGSSFNIGGLIGYYKGGTIGIPKPRNITLQGSYNVGGAIGFADAPIECTSIDGWSFMSGLGDGTGADKNSFATIKSTTLVTNGGNWGGLIGKASANCEINGFINFNKITFDRGLYKDGSGLFKNIGGIVGYTDGRVVGAINKADIIVQDLFDNERDNNDNELTYNTFTTGKETEKEDITISTKPINVGGIAGMSGAGSFVIGCENQANIKGYQSVGGLVGYATGFVGFNSYSVKDLYIGENVKYYTFNEAINKYELITDYESLTEDSICYGTSLVGGYKIIGTINVGGAVGYLAENAQVRGVDVLADVRGNTNVGGLVGLTANGAVVTNNSVLNSDATNEKANVKGILFFNLINVERFDGTEILDSYYVLPTSIGGLIGSTESNTVRIEDSTVNAKIETVAEGETASINSYGFNEGRVKNQGSNVISTVSNFMFAKVTASAKNEINFLDLSLSDEASKKGNVQFDNIKSGIGGLIGTTSTKTALYGSESNRSISTNHINVTINAPLGVNVGLHYGYYGVVSSDKIKIELPVLDAEASVSGAYNIGGAIGCFTSDSQASNFEFEYNPNFNVSVQPTGSGMYVGGVFGKVVENIDALKTNGNITIFTGNSYYIGGLVGRLEGNMNGVTTVGSETTYNVDATNVKFSGDTVTNVGGLVGMLKVTSTSGETITVKGKHNKAFTINTIENQNYTDSGATYKAVTDSTNNTVTIYAIARYVNKDKFEISPSQNTNNLDHNPLYSDKVEMSDGKSYYTHPGWHISYTGFKSMQRFIPMTENNGAEWDSIATIYDASKINAVKSVTEEGSGYTKDEIGQILYTIYEDYENVPTIYTKFGWGQIFHNENGNIEKPDGEFKQGYNESYITIKNFYYLDESITDQENPKYGSKKLYDEIYFEYKVKYQESKQAESGSIFEVNGYGSSDYKGILATKQDKAARVKLAVWQSLLVLADAAMVIGLLGSIVSGGATGVAGAGLSATAKIGAKIGAKAFAKAYLKGALKNLIKATVIKKLLITFAIGYGVNVIAKEQMMTYYNTGTIVQNLEGEVGYLSNMYYRDISLDKDSNTKAVADKVKVIDGQPYHLYSSSRPLDYYSNYWMVINKTNGAVEFFSMETSQDTIIQTLKDKWGADSNISPTDILRACVYSEGYYWKHSFTATTTEIQANMIESSYYANNLGVKMPYVTFNNYAYVYGKYDLKNEIYSFAEDRDDGNKVEYSNGIYSLNDATLTNNASSIAPVVTETLSYIKSTLSPEKKSKLILGYDYFEGAYYAVAGNNKMPSKRARFVYNENYDTSGKTINVDYVIRTFEKVEYIEDPTANYYKNGSGYYVLDLIYQTRYVQNSDGTYTQNNTGNYYYDGDNYIILPTEYQTRYRQSITEIPEACYEISYIADDQNGLDKVDSAYSDKRYIDMDIYPYSFKNPYSSTTMFTGNAKDNETYGYQTDTNHPGVVKHQVSYYLWEGGYELTADKKVMTVFNQEIYASNYRDKTTNGKKKWKIPDEKSKTFYFSDGLVDYQIEFDNGTTMTLADIYDVNESTGDINYKSTIKGMSIDEFKKLEYDGYNFCDYYRLKVDSIGHIKIDINGKGDNEYINGTYTKGFNDEGKINATKYVMYRIDSKYTLSAEEGCDVKTIHEVILTVKDENHQINDNKYCNTNGDIKFYTRYKFGSDLFGKISGITFGNSNAFIKMVDDLISNPLIETQKFSFYSEKLFNSGESFYLLQQNGGYSTKFSEAVTVVMKSRNGEGGSITIQ